VQAGGVDLSILGFMGSTYGVYIYGRRFAYMWLWEGLDIAAIKWCEIYHEITCTST
jgi:hypothetical protein